MLDADLEVERRDFTVHATLQVGPGERLALFGPSGAGKTTLLEVIAGLVQPGRGRVVLRGRVLTSTSPPRCALPPWQRRVGLLRQDPGLFPHLSVMQNLAYAPASGGPAEVRELAALLGIGELLSVMPMRLSGGQAHRVALGRLLLAPCDALLLDEPYTGLDAALRRTLTDLVVSLVSVRNIPALLVAHELVEAQAFAHRLAVLDRGRILQVGPPGEVVRRPASRRVAELVGYRAFVPVRGLSQSGALRQRVNTTAAGPVGAGPVGASPVGASPVGASPVGAGSGGEGGTAVPGPTAGVHPERVVGGAHPGRGLVLAGVVTACRPAGGGWEVDLNTEGTTIGCRLPDKPVDVGDSFIVTALDPPYFGAEGAAIEAQSVAVGPVGSTSVGEP
jgi:ABC-type sulfate/molybdate transport systems ATPase subunit